MPRNKHTKKVTYEGVEESTTIYVTSRRWEGDILFVRHYPNHNDEAYLHEDSVAGISSKTKEIPRERVYAVDDIDS